MEEKDIKLVWKDLTTKLIIGAVIFICSLLFNLYGSKKTNPQVLSMFGEIAGLVFIIIPGFKMLQFRKFLKNKDK
ncbi:MAG: hypothetical protein ACKVQB_04960 [Bacteroidia bacterium]